MANIEIYHVPGEMNICADLLSRAISENLNCALQRDHPISKKWAKHLPPIRDNFSVDNETLFKFLTTPLTLIPPSCDYYIFHPSLSTTWAHAPIPSPSAFFT